jgi:hypothetical protein
MTMCAFMVSFRFHVVYFIYLLLLIWTCTAYQVSHLTHSPAPPFKPNLTPFLGGAPYHPAAHYSTIRTLCWILVIPSNYTHSSSCFRLYLHGVRLTDPSSFVVPICLSSSFIPDSKLIETQTVEDWHGSDYRILANLQTDM